MTTLRTAAQQALEAMLSFPDDISDEMFESITALKAALVEDAMQKFTDVNQELEAALAEPQTWVCPDSAEHRYQKPGHCEDCGKTLVQVVEPVPDSKHATIAEWSADKQRSPLTEEEIYSLFRTAGSPTAFARAIERAHGVT